MAFSGTFDNVMDPTTQGAVDAVANKSLDGVLDVAYTMLQYLLNFFLQPTVILAGIGLALIAYFYSFGVSYVKSKIASGTGSGT